MNFSEALSELKNGKVLSKPKKKTCTPLQVFFLHPTTKKNQIVTI